jgi:hypothetical protein
MMIDLEHERRNPSSVDAAADKAVKKVFAILGVDIDKPESVEEFREDLRFGRKLRRAADHGFLAVIGLIVAGICALLVAGATNRMGGG